MTIAVSNLTSGGGASGTNFTTASVSPAAQSVVLVTVNQFVSGTVDPAAPTVSGLGLSWSTVITVVTDPSGTDRATTSLHVGTGTATTGTISITTGATVGNCGWVVDQATGVDTSAPIVQSNGAAATEGASTASTTLNAFADATNNAAYACFGIEFSGADTFTPENGWTAVGAATAQPWVHTFTEWRLGQDTTPSGSWSTGGFGCGILAVELKVAGGPKNINVGQATEINRLPASSDRAMPITVSTSGAHNINVGLVTETDLARTVVKRPFRINVGQAVETDLARTVSSTAFPTSRNKYDWPFTQGSIWNMPIGSNADYQPANLLNLGADTQPDEEYIGVNPNDPLKNLTAGDEGALGQVHVPPTYNWDGNWNGSTTFLDTDNDHVWQGQPLTLTAGGDPSWNDTFPHVDPVTYQWAANAWQYSLSTDDGILGAHGGSHLSAIGGSIRLGELNGPNPIRHALKINLDARRFLYNAGGNGLNASHRWPAASADDPATHYGTMDPQLSNPNPKMVMGALLALPPSFNVASLTSAQGRKIAQALQDYGAYITDDSAGSYYALAVEISEVPNWRGGNGWHTYTVDPDVVDDLNTIWPNLKVIDNNTASTIGGGGTPRQPLAPPFGQAVTIGQAVETDRTRVVTPRLRNARETDAAQQVRPVKSRTLGQATQTSTSQTVAHVKTRAVAQTTETDAAQATTRVRSRAVAQTTETDAAQLVSASGQKNIAVGQVVETDTASGTGRSKAHAALLVTTTSLSQPIGRLKARAASQTAESDTAQPVTSSGQKNIAVGQTVETDRAWRVTPQLRSALETDAAQQVRPAKSRVLAQATEADSTTTAQHTKQRAVGLLAETDQSLPVSSSGNKNIPAGQTLETELARPVTAAKRKSVGAPVAETDSPLSATRQKSRTTALPAETDQAQTLTRVVKRVTVNMVGEADAARQLVISGNKNIPVGQVIATTTAQTVRPAKGRTLTVVTTTETAQALAKTTKQHAVGQTSSVQTSQPIRPVKVRTIGLALETDTTTATGKTKRQVVSVVVETDTAGVLGGWAQVWAVEPRATLATNQTRAALTSNRTNASVTSNRTRVELR